MLRHEGHEGLTSGFKSSLVSVAPSLPEETHVRQENGLQSDARRSCGAIRGCRQGCSACNALTTVKARSPQTSIDRSWRRHLSEAFVEIAALSIAIEDFNLSVTLMPLGLEVTCAPGADNSAHLPSHPAATLRPAALNPVCTCLQHLPILLGCATAPHQGQITRAVPESLGTHRSLRPDLAVVPLSRHRGPALQQRLRGARCTAHARKSPHECIGSAAACAPKRTDELRQRCSVLGCARPVRHGHASPTKCQRSTAKSIGLASETCRAYSAALMLCCMP